MSELQDKVPDPDPNPPVSSYEPVRQAMRALVKSPGTKVAIKLQQRKRYHRMALIERLQVVEGGSP